ncbi:hypothetical protein BDR26DRAFT_436155 [Obelidium mucronatum]|nr:hypothetical protein BDR26DRAFT_436155 [Obelidium mucronatum]
MKIARYSIPLVECTAGIARDMYYAETLVPKLVDRVVDEQEALQAGWDWLLVPHCATHVYHSCVFGATSPARPPEGQHIENIMSQISTKWDYWNKTHGSNHLFVFSWDQASEVLGWDSPIRSKISKAVHLTALGSLDPKVLPNHNPSKDIVIPTFANYSYALSIYPDLPSCHLSRFLSYSMGLLSILKSSDWIAAKLFREPTICFSAGWAFKPRNIFAYFRGTIIDDYRYSFGVRQYIRELGNTHPERYYVRDQHTTTEEYWKELGEST